MTASGEGELKKGGSNEIYAEKTDSGIFIPIKPICEAIGIDAKWQRDKIQSDEILPSVGGLKTSTGADGKQYEMYCLPLEYVYGWIFTINPRNVPSPSRRERFFY